MAQMLIRSDALQQDSPHAIKTFWMGPFVAFEVAEAADGNIQTVAGIIREQSVLGQPILTYDSRHYGYHGVSVTAVKLPLLYAVFKQVAVRLRGVYGCAA